MSSYLIIDCVFMRVLVIVFIIMIKLRMNGIWYVLVVMVYIWY